MQALSAMGSSHPALAFTTYKHLSNRLVEAHADTTVRQLSQNRWLQACTKWQKKVRNWWNVHQIMHKGSCPLFHIAKERAKVTFEDIEVPRQHQRRKSSLAAYFRRLYNEYNVYHYHIISYHIISYHIIYIYMYIYILCTDIYRHYRFKQGPFQIFQASVKTLEPFMAPQFLPSGQDRLSIATGELCNTCQLHPHLAQSLPRVQKCGIYMYLPSGELT